MMRHRTARQAASAAALLAVTGLALAGCKSSTGAAGTSSPAATSCCSSASASSVASPATSSASSASSGGGSGSVGPADFPVATGNTWVYDVTISGVSHGTITNKVTSVTPVAGGQRVTMAIADSAVGAGTSTSVTYLFHSDGSISVPLTQLGSTVIKIKSGSIVWPSAAQLASGQPQKSTLVFSASAAGKVIQSTADVTVQGHGSQTVTVPAGTYHAQLIDETMAEKFDGVGLTLTLQTWVANGVGPIKSELATSTGSAGTPTTVEVLKSFTKG